MPISKYFQLKYYAEPIGKLKYFELNMELIVNTEFKKIIININIYEYISVCI